MIKIGHRGAAGYEPENTLRSFKKALELGADMVELDVRLSKDGYLVVFHDDSLDRITGEQGKIEDLSLSQIQEYDVGQGERIPTLTEVLDLIDKRVAVNIELKGGGLAEQISILINQYISNKNWNPELFLVSSFDKGELVKFININPGARIGILARKNILSAIRMAHHHKAYSIHLPKPYLKRVWIKWAHRIGVRVFVYTLNSLKDIARAKKMGVDGTFSDYPDRI